MKKFLCMAISLFLIFNCLPFSAAYVAQAETLLTANESDDKNELIFIEDLIGAVEGDEDRKTQLLTEQINILKAIYPDLKIYEDFKGEVTRADFLKMLVQLTAGDDYPLYTDFIDVEETDTELLACLGYAVEMGLVSKSDSFRPDDAISYNEMIKMAVVSCGYEIVAQRKGGWPSGYLGVANQIGLMDFFEKSSGLASADDAYRLLYNVVTVSLLEQKTFSEDASFEINKGSSMLSDRFNVRIIEDIVYSNNLTSLTRELSGKGEPTITIGVHTYKNNTGKDLLGYNVRAFLLENNGQDTLISIRKYNNTEVFIDNFSGMDGYTIKEKNPDGTTDNYNLFRGYSLLLNDVAAPGVRLADYIGRDDVSLRLIDNNRDGKYDVVKLYIWKHMQIEKIDYVDEIVFGNKATDSMLDMGKENAVYKIFDCNNGVLSEIEFEDLKKDDILTYVTSSNLKSIKIFRSTTSVSGVYRIKNGDTITVGDTEYELSLYAKNNYPNIIFGLETTLLLDPTGRVVSVSQLGNDFRYGWIVKSAQEDFTKKVSVKIFDQEGSMKIFDVAEKIYIDNIPKKATDFHDIEQALVDDRLVKYGLNDKGELNMIDFPAVFTTGLPFVNNNHERDSFTQYYDAYLSKKGNGSFGTKFLAESGTLFFSIPVTDRDNDELYLMKSYSNFRNGGVTLKAYDMEAGTGPKVALTFSSSPAIAVDYYSGAEIVVDIRYARNENDAFKRQIQTYNGTQYNNYFVRDDVDISSVMPGDIIRISSYKNEIYSLNIDYSFNTNTIAADALPSSGQEKNLYYKGYVYGYGTRMVQLWDTLNINSAVTIDKIYGLDFREQSVIFVDVYKNADGTVSEVIARYKPISEIRDYVHAGANADFMVARMQENNYVKKWVYRVINE